jgi:hypothetical protein
MLVLMLNCETTQKNFTIKKQLLYNIKFLECQFDDVQNSNDLLAQTYGSNRNHRPTRVV